MLAHVLVLLVATQTFDVKVFPPSPLDDAVFSILVENWVIDTHRVYNLSEILSEDDCRRLRMLDHDRFIVRQCSRNVLRANGDACRRALVWGATQRSLEVREACRGILADLYMCPDCQGTGVCTHPDVRCDCQYLWNPEFTSGRLTCVHCTGRSVSCVFPVRRR